MRGMVDGKQARELNEVIRYTAWSVFTVSTPLADARRGRATPPRCEALFAELAGNDVDGARHLRRGRRCGPTPS